MNKIVKKNGEPDSLAIDIYNKTKMIQAKRSNSHEVQMNYEFLTNVFRCSRELIRRKLVMLEQLGLIKREFKTQYLNGRRVDNIMYIKIKS